MIDKANCRSRGHSCLRYCSKILSKLRLLAVLRAGMPAAPTICLFSLFFFSFDFTSFLVFFFVFSAYGRVLWSHIFVVLVPSKSCRYSLNDKPCIIYTGARRLKSASPFLMSKTDEPVKIQTIPQ